MKEFMTRNLTAVFLIALAYAWIQLTSPLVFSLILFLITAGAAWEWIGLCNPVQHHFTVTAIAGLVVAASFTFQIPGLGEALILVLFIFGIYFLFSIRASEQLTTFVRDFGIHVGAVLYIFVPLYYLLRLKELGPNYLFFLIGVIAIGDSFAYFVGSIWAKYGRRIAIYPIASPRKSLQGLVAAVLSAGAAALLVRAVFPIPVNDTMAVISGAILGLLSQLSDPVESLFKRAAGKKDSGMILPGHGGILDRVDSYIFCAPALYFSVLYLWK